MIIKELYEKKRKAQNVDKVKPQGNKMVFKKIVVKKDTWQFLKLFLTIFVIILIPVYWHYYGLQNFLWLSDIGLFLTVLALWTNSLLLMSMAGVGILLVELAWNIDFFAQLIFIIKVIGVSDYMYESSYPLALRALSLFHVIMPGIWLVYLAQHGYDKRAFYYFTLLYWVILLTTYLFTCPQANINWVFFPQAHGIETISPFLWVVILSISFPLLLFLPTHYWFKKVFKTKYQDSW